MSRLLFALPFVISSGCATPGGAAGAATRIEPQAPPVREKQKPAPAAKPILLPGITVDRQTGEVKVNGSVCIEGGVLEYVAVAAGGKEYESVFSLDCRPSHLHMAMLIAGYHAGELATEFLGDYSPEADRAANLPPDGAPKGTPPPEQYFEARTGTEPSYVTVDVEVRQADGFWERYPVEHFLMNRRTGTSPERMTWAFTGSFFHKDPTAGLEVFIADVEKSLVALWYDPTALLNVAENVGNPYRGDTGGLEAGANALPDRGTPIRIILRPAPAISR